MNPESQEEMRHPPEETTPAKDLQVNGCPACREAQEAGTSRAAQTLCTAERLVAPHCVQAGTSTAFAHLTAMLNHVQ